MEPRRPKALPGRSPCRAGARGAWLLTPLLALTLSVPGHAGRRLSDQYDVRRIVHEYLVRMGGLEDEGSLERKVHELAREVGAFPDLALKTLGHFLRNPESGFDECTVTRCLGRFGRDDPELAVKVMVRGLPTRHREGDRCVSRALASIGPPAYPSLLRCATGQRPGRAFWCLHALVEQSRGLEKGDHALAEIIAATDSLAPGGEAADIRAAARSWDHWWSNSRDTLQWDEEAGRLGPR